MNRPSTARLAAFLAVAALAAAAGACAGGSPYAFVATNGGSPSPSPSVSAPPSPSPSPSSSPGGQNCVVAIPPAGVQIVGLNLNNEATCNDTTFQLVQGYFGGSSITASQVMSVTHSGTNVIEFQNLDGQEHTASLVGPWMGSYPQNGPGFGNASPKDTDISATGWTTGLLNGGQTSRQYRANVPGMYIIGCAIHYTLGMRTVIIVQ